MSQAKTPEHLPTRDTRCRFNIGTLWPPATPEFLQELGPSIVTVKRHVDVERLSPRRYVPSDGSAGRTVSFVRPIERRGRLSQATTPEHLPTRDTRCRFNIGTLWPPATPEFLQELGPSIVTVKTTRRCGASVTSQDISLLMEVLGAPVSFVRPIERRGRCLKLKLPHNC